MKLTTELLESAQNYRLCDNRASNGKVCGDCPNCVFAQCATELLEERKEHAALYKAITKLRTSLRLEELHAAQNELLAVLDQYEQEK